MYSRILVALDGSQTASRALDEAIKLGSESGAELQPVYAVDVPILAYDVPGYDPSIVRDAYLQEGKQVCIDAQTRMSQHGVNGTPRCIEVVLPAEDVAQTIKRAAEAFHADLIVMGTHGRRGIQRVVLGSVAERVLRCACCPVLLVPARSTRSSSETNTKDISSTDI